MQGPHASPPVSEAHQAPRAILSSGPVRASLSNMNLVIRHLRQASNIKTEIKMNRTEKFKGYTNNAGDYQNDKKCLQRKEIASMKKE